MSHFKSKLKAGYLNCSKLERAKTGLTKCYNCNFPIEINELRGIFSGKFLCFLCTKKAILNSIKHDEMSIKNNQNFLTHVELWIKSNPNSSIFRALEGDNQI